MKFLGAIDESKDIINKEFVDSTLKSYQPLITDSSKLAYSLISGVPSISISGTSVSLGGSITQSALRTALGLGSNAYTSTAYLPLSGGAIDSAASSYPLAVNTTKNNAEIGIILKNNGNSVSQVGWYIGAGTRLYDYASNSQIRIYEGIPYFNDGYIWHSGNFTPSNYLPLTGGTLSGSTAYTLTIKRIGDKPLIAFNQGDDLCGFLGITNQSQPVFVSNNGSTEYIIHSSNIGSYNAGSATKLQTARTIWGQSFDGTGNIGGKLIINNNTDICGKATDGTAMSVLHITAGNNLSIGLDVAAKGYDTYISGNNIYLRYGTSRTTGFILNSSGNVTIGSSDLASTNHKLYVNGTGQVSDRFYFGEFAWFNRGKGGVYYTGNSISWHDSSDKYASTLLSFGDKSVTINQPTTVQGSIRTIGEIKINVSDTPYDRMRFVVNASSAYIQASNANGSSPSDGQLYISGNGMYSLKDFEVRATTSTFKGNILATGGVTMYSQRSLKNIVDERGLSLEELSVIKPTRYTWKDTRDNRLHIGGIADDVQKVLPEVIYKTGEDDTLTMDYGNAAFAIASSLIKPVSEHERRIKALEDENERLKKEIEILKWNIA